MDKQDAIDFIVQEFENGRSPQDIASSLSARMNAPVEVVARFVQRTLEPRQSLAEDTLSRLNRDTPVIEPPKPATLTWKETIARAPTGNPFAGLNPETPGAAEPVPQNLPDEIASLRAQAAPAVDDPSPRPSQEVSEPIDPRLEKFILELLYKNGKHTDVVTAVSERAAIDWRDAERLVAQVGAAHHKQITSRRNRVLIPLSLTFVALGLGVAYAGISELFALGPMLSALLSGGAQAVAQVPPPADFSTRSFWAIGLGSALIVGGLLGALRAVRPEKPEFIDKN